jgi:hypothetical protein
MEDSTLSFGIVVLGQDDLLLTVGTAYRGTVAVAAFQYLPGTDALDPGYLPGMSPVGSPQDLPFVRPGGAQQPLEVHAGDYVLELTVAVFLPQSGIERLETRSQQHGPYVYVNLLRLLFQIDGIVFTYGFADTAFLFLKVKTAFIDIGDQGNGLGEVDMNGFVIRDSLIELVRISYRAVLHAGGTAGALVLVDIPGFFSQ